MTTNVAQVVQVIEELFPPQLKEPWDKIGLVTGDVNATVTRLLITVDVNLAVVEYAVAHKVNFILAHHPLLFTPVSSVTTLSDKGKIINFLIKNDISLYCAHTNADNAKKGVAESLANKLRVKNLRAIKPIENYDSWYVYVPPNSYETLFTELNRVGAGKLGEYENCNWSTLGEGRFTPLAAANPTIGTNQVLNQVAEIKLEFIAENIYRSQLEDVITKIHPYETPAFGYHPIYLNNTAIGAGRWGQLSSELSLADFADLIQSQLVLSKAGIRVAGNLAKRINTVAVCGGAGDSLLSFLPSVIDVYITGDLRHHVVDEHLRLGGCALIDIGHWASEFPWCVSTKELLAKKIRGVEMEVYDIPTDNWSLILGS